MDYFREKLLTYSTQKQMSTLLHIYTQSDKPKTGIPMAKTQNYVDQILDDYSVKMYTYPDLSPQDNRLAYSIYMQRKTNGNVFQFEQFKRKPLKKKVVRKIILPLTPEQIPQKVERTCPCCDSKLVMKHKCQHNLCQKPCNRMKRHKALGSEQASQQWKKGGGVGDEQQQFTPEKSELEHESKSSNVDHQSDFSEEMEMMEEFSDSQSFLSNISKNKKAKNRGRTRKQNNNRNRRSRRNAKNPSRRSSRREIANIMKDQQYVHQIEKEKTISNLPQNNPPLIEVQTKQADVFKELGPRRRKIIKKPEPKLHQSSSNNIQSQFEPQVLPPNPKDLRTKRSSTLFQRKVSQQQPQPQIEKDVSGDFQNCRFKKKQQLSYFCTPQELKSNQIFNIRIIDDRNSHKKVQEIPRYVEQKIEPEREEMKNVEIEEQEIQPMVDAVLEQVSNDNQNQNEDPIFQPDEND